MTSRVGAGPLGRYRTMLEDGTLASDAAQALAVERLQDLWVTLRGYDPAPAEPAGGLLGRLLRRRPAADIPEDHPGGLYLVGEVGRGKSMLMDLFFDAAEVPRRRRVHFHAFMQEAHASMHAWRQTNPDGADPVPPLAARVAAEAALLCFDEFQVEDVADALLLGRLFQALFGHGVVVVATSNTAPADLFAGRPGRDAFLPFIALLTRHLDVLVLDSPRDFRRGRGHGGTHWHVPADARADAALDAAFAELAQGAGPRADHLIVAGRRVRIPVAAGPVARFEFETLCGAALGPADYLALATHYPALVLDAVPRLSPDNHDLARRFITLVDALYEHRVKLVASAAAAPDQLYRRGDGARAFERTASRLVEMQSARYWALAHLT